MISSIKGKVISVNSLDRVIELELGGMGLSFYVPDEKIYVIDKEYKVYTYFYWNQENGPSLYGFDSVLAKQVFSLIISCSGVGPKIGLSALSQSSPEEIINNIILADTKSLSKINGIGAKKAELIIASLKEKASKLFSGLSSDNNIINKLKSVSDVLISLGYNSFEIKSAIDYIKSEISSSENCANINLDNLLRQALSFIVKLNNNKNIK